MNAEWVGLLVLSLPCPSHYCFAGGREVPPGLGFCAVVMVNVDLCVTIFLISPTQSSGTGARDDVSF